jgi:CheY-like chemotaxis protein
MLERFLLDNGFNVITAFDGEEALSKVEGGHPDLLLLDVQMPKVNGYSFLFELKKIDSGRPIPVIVLTCKEEMKDIFLVEGVKEYLVKPVLNSDLLKKIQQHIGV